MGPASYIEPGQECREYLLVHHNFFVIKRFLYHSRNRRDWSTWKRQQYILHFKPFTFKRFGNFISRILNASTIAHVRYIKILILRCFIRLNCKFFTTPLSRNSRKRLEHKPNQTKYRNMTRKPRSRIKILIYLSWTIELYLELIDTTTSIFNVCVTLCR